MKAKYLTLAKQASLKSDHSNYPMGCVIVKGNRILGVGHNMCRTHPKSPHKFKSIHAEFMAALNAGYSIDGATVYVFRQFKDGTPAIARPCSDCWKFLHACGVKEVIYSCQGTFKKEQII